MVISNINDIVNNGFLYHHSAWTRGYISRKIDYVISPYCGRFGKGFRIEYPCYHSTQYHRIDYMVRRQDFKTDYQAKYAEFRTKNLFEG